MMWCEWVQLWVCRLEAMSTGGSARDYTVEGMDLPEPDGTGKTSQTSWGRSRQVRVRDSEKPPFGMRLYMVVRALEQFRVDDGVSLKLLNVRVESKTKQAKALSRVGSQKPQMGPLPHPACSCLQGWGCSPEQPIAGRAEGPGAVPHATAHVGKRGRRGLLPICL